MTQTTPGNATVEEAVFIRRPLASPAGLQRSTGPRRIEIEYHLRNATDEASLGLTLPNPEGRRPRRSRAFRSGPSTWPPARDTSPRKIGVMASTSGAERHPGSDIRREHTSQKRSLSIRCAQRDALSIRTQYRRNFLRHAREYVYWSLHAARIRRTRKMAP